MTAIHPVFVVIVLVLGSLLWVSLRRTFKAIGGKAKKLAEDTKRCMEIDTENEKKEKETIEQ